jgi:hypothetical protein
LRAPRGKPELSEASGVNGPNPAGRVVSTSFSRWPFSAAAAVAAAASSDLLVEAVANAGAFGPAFFAANDASIVAAFVTASPR